jgi:hypothetical protein
MSDMPDFDSMTPEEMMKWMESLAKRQGATEGLTTDADMEIQEVSKDDERLQGMGEYKPYGMSDEDWEKLQAKEQAQKQARLQAKQQVPPAAPTPIAVAPEPEPEPVTTAGGDMPDFDSMTPEEMMKWMESLAVRQGATEGLTTAADMEIQEVSKDDERLQGMGEYKPYGMSDDDWEKLQAKEQAQKQARLQAKQQAPAPEPEIVMADLSMLGLDEPEEEFEMAAAEFDFDALGLEETSPIEPVAEQSPMDWLSGLADAEDEIGGLDFDMDSLGALEGLGEADSAGDPMAWLQGLAADEGNGDILADLTAMTGDSEGSLEWMESLARDHGADSEELITAADLDIPRPEAVRDDGPGYEEFSFEQGTGMVQDTDQLEAILSQSGQKSGELELANPEAWLDQLASGVSGGAADEDEREAQWILQEDEDAEELDYNSISGDLSSKLSSGTAAPEDIEAFFTAAFQQAAKRSDVPDYLDTEDEDEEIFTAPVQAEIPDWLQESMASSAVDDDEEIELATPAKTSTAEMMIQDLGLDEALEEAEIPDWLQSSMGEDSGDISVDIFAEEILEELDESEKAISPTDTSDTWVQAFSEEESGDLDDWYESAVAQLGGQTAPASPPMGHLQSADLPIERNLPEGTPQGIPDWLGTQRSIDPMSDSIEMASVAGGDMDWLGTDDTEAIDSDMPDWLKETVDDSITSEEDMPSWLQGQSVDVEPDEIPDWLRETMDEEEDVAAMDFLSEDEEDEAGASIFMEQAAPTPAAVTTPPAMPVPVKQSPAPVSVPVANIDVTATMKSGQEKIASGDIDGGLLDYEQVVRANAALAQIEALVQKLADNEKTKKHPAVHRVLGDVLMRQGKLQQALDTYRKALNLL